MVEDEAWLAELFEEQGPTLHRLAVMLGAETQSGHIIRTALLGLSRRERRIVDPAERVEYLIEHVVHQARSARGSLGQLQLQEVADPRQNEICRAVAAMPVRLGEILLVSHYLSIFGAALAGVMRMTVKGSNQRLTEAVEQLRVTVGDPVPGSQPGVVESLSEELTAALRAAARLVQAPGTETLELELRALRARRDGVPLWVSTLFVAGALAVGGTLAWATTGRSEPVPSPSPVMTTNPAGAAARSRPSQVQSVPVYYVGRADSLLYRELRDLPVSGSLVQTAANAILSLAPLDPDYDSEWTPGRVVSATVEAGVLTIDLSADSYLEFGSEADAGRAVDQMVYTASDILGEPDLVVRFLADGAEPPAPFRGEHRRDGLTPLGKLWINSPGNTAKLPAGKINISGLTQESPTAPRILVSNSEGVLLTSLFAQIDIDPDGDGWRAWSVTLDLGPGEYQIVAEGSYGETVPQLLQQNRTITVS